MSTEKLLAVHIRRISRDGAISDHHVARLVFQSVNDPSADSARVMFLPGGSWPWPD